MSVARLRIVVDAFKGIEQSLVPISQEAHRIGTEGTRVTSDQLHDLMRDLQGLKRRATTATSIEQRLYHGTVGGPERVAAGLSDAINALDRLLLDGPGGYDTRYTYSRALVGVTEARIAALKAADELDFALRH
jgi:hypothetical protein